MDREINSSLEQKLDKMENLLNITQSISEIIKKEDTEELLKVFKTRQQVMDDIDLLDKKLLKFFKNDAYTFKKHILKSDSKLKVTYDNILSLTKKIKGLDDANLESTKTLFSNLKQDITALKQTETALKGYGIIGTNNRDGAFIDTKK